MSGTERIKRVVHKHLDFSNREAVHRQLHLIRLLRKGLADPDLVLDQLADECELIVHNTDSRTQMLDKEASG